MEGRIDLLCGGGDKAVEWRMAPETTHIKGCTHRAIILYDGAIKIVIERNNLKPSHSGNTYPARFTAILTKMICDGF